MRRRRSFGLHAELFLVGILCEDTADRHPVCLEPEDCGFDPAQFSGVKRRGGAASRGNPESRVMHSHPAAQQSHDRRLINHSLQEAIPAAVRPRRRGSPIRATGRFTFCRKFMRKSVSVARRARYNSSRSLRLWKTALPRDGDLGRRFRGMALRRRGSGGSRCGQ